MLQLQIPSSTQNTTTAQHHNITEPKKGRPTKKLRPIPPRNPHQLPLPTGVIRQIRCKIVDFAVYGRPRVVFLIVQFEDGGGDAHELSCSALLCWEIGRVSKGGEGDERREKERRKGGCGAGDGWRW